MCRWTGSALVQIMACRLFGAKPLPEPIMTSSQLDALQQTWVKFKTKHKTLHSWKCIWKCRLESVNLLTAFCPGGRWVNKFVSGHFNWHHITYLTLLSIKVWCHYYLNHYWSHRACVVHSFTFVTGISYLETKIRITKIFLMITIKYISTSLKGCGITTQSIGIIWQSFTTHSLVLRISLSET